MLGAHQRAVGIFGRLAMVDNLLIGERESKGVRDVYLEVVASYIVYCFV